MSFIEKVKAQAKENVKTIVLPEADDIRTLQATEVVLKEIYANIVLIGNEQEISELAKTKEICLDGATIINPKTSPDYEEYVQKFYELRKQKGMTEDKAKEIILDPVYFGMMMVKMRKS